MQSLSGIYKITFVGLAVLVAGAGYFFYQSQAGTTINVTLDSNDSLNQGLVGHWTFDGQDVDWSSTTAEIRDVSGNNIHGDALGGMSATSSPMAGVLGQGLRFQGPWGTYINMPNADPADDLAEKTACAWINISDPVINGIISKDSDAGGGWTFHLRDYSSDGRPELAYRQYYGTDLGEWGTAEILPNVTYHVCVAHDNTSVTNDPAFFVNGAAVVSSEGRTPEGVLLSDSGNDLQISNSGDSFFWTFNGLIDDVRLYDRILSADEVKRLYQLGATTKIGQTIDTNPNLENGLVMHYTFDGKDINYSSTTAEIIDKSGNNLHGDWINHATTTVQGVIGQAINIQQGSAPYSCVRNASSSLISTLGPMTMGVWVKEDATGGTTLFQTGVGVNVLNLSLQGADLRFVRRYSTSDLSKEAVPTFPMHTLEWTHYAVTWDGTTASTGVKIYGNGVRITSDGYAFDGSGTPYALSGIIHLGCNMFDDQGYQGPMDDFRLYNRVLSAEEVKRLYQLGATTKVAQTLPGIEDGLVGHWTFDGPVSSGIPDVSGNGYTGYFMSSVATATALTQGVTGQGVYIDGYDEHYPYADTVDNMSTFTVCAWVRPSALTNRDGDPSMNIISKGWSLSLQNTGRYQMYVPTSGVYGWVYSSSVARLGEWQHVCGIHYNTSTDPAVFFNGVREIYSPQGPGGSLEDNSSRRLFIGGTAGNSTYENFYGSIDDVRVYNRALSAEEVKRLYDLGR